MKHLKLFIMCLVFFLIGCLGHPNLEKDYEAYEQQQVKENVDSIFGVSFPESNTWATSFSVNVKVNINSEGVKKVQILGLINDPNTTDEDGDATSLVILNEYSLNGEQTSISLVCDIPNDYLGLYCNFIWDDKHIVKKITNNEVSLVSTASTRGEGEELQKVSYPLPEGEFYLTNSIPSYAAERGWLPDELLYELSEYESQKISVPDYDAEYKDVFRSIVFSYFKNGRKYNNLPLVKASGYYNDKIYPITTGGDPIFISVVYKNDGRYKEVENSDLYYYYYKEDKLGINPRSFLEGLPKFKLMPLKDCIKGDDVIEKHTAYALMYYGDRYQVHIGNQGTYNFPPGYKIGFMVRAKTTAEGGKKQGELYGDGRLNNYINNYDKCNFRSSKLGEDGPRATWLNVNDRLLMCWESGTDADFNDIIIEAEGGIYGITNIPEFEHNKYTFLFEDTKFGDYDMNDVVLTGERVDMTHVKYTILACGAIDALFIKNLKGSVIDEYREVHKYFDASQDAFINTETINYGPSPMWEVFTVDKDFSFTTDVDKLPYIYNKTKDNTVKLSKQGEDPHGIMIPYEFRWPKEKICIKDAYTEFNNWGMNQITSTDWYKKPIIEKTLIIE